jgi:hypothetical protein
MEADSDEQDDLTRYDQTILVNRPSPDKTQQGYTIFKPNVTQSDQDEEDEVPDIVPGSKIPPISVPLHKQEINSSKRPLVAPSDSEEEEDDEEEDLVMKCLTRPVNPEKLMSALLREHELVLTLKRQLSKVTKRLVAIEEELKTTRKREQKWEDKKR